MRTTTTREMESSIATSPVTTTRSEPRRMGSWSIDVTHRLEVGAIAGGLPPPVHPRAPVIGAEHASAELDPAAARPLDRDRHLDPIPADGPGPEDAGAQCGQ